MQNKNVTQPGGTHTTVLNLWNGLFSRIQDHNRSDDISAFAKGIENFQGKKVFKTDGNEYKGKITTKKFWKTANRTFREVKKSLYNNNANCSEQTVAAKLTDVQSRYEGLKDEFQRQKLLLFGMNFKYLKYAYEKKWIKDMNENWKTYVNQEEKLSQDCKLRILTWNLKTFCLSRLKNILNHQFSLHFLSFLKRFDVIALQEVSATTTEGSNVMTELCEQLKSFCKGFSLIDVVPNNCKKENCTFGQSFLYKTDSIEPVDDQYRKIGRKNITKEKGYTKISGYEIFTETYQKFFHGLNSFKFSKNGKTFRLLNVHFPWESKGNRTITGEAEILGKAIANLKKFDKDTIHIVAGDFNYDKVTKDVWSDNQLSKVLKVINGFHTNAGKNKFYDGFFVDENMMIEKDVTVYNSFPYYFPITEELFGDSNALVSDHFPVVLSLKWNDSREHSV